MSEKMTRLVETARRFVAAADEFLPEYPGAISEHLDALISRIDDLGEGDEAGAGILQDRGSDSAGFEV